LAAFRDFDARAEGDKSMKISVPDKKEGGIIKKAKEIETYEISILPHEDCCTRFVPKHPETKANLKEVQLAEKKLNVKKMIKEAMEKIEIEIIKN